MTLEPSRQVLVDNPRQSLQIALNTLFTALRLVKAGENGRFDAELLATDIQLVNADDPNGAAFHIVASKNPPPLSHRLDNLMLVAAGSLFLQFDEVARQEIKCKGGRFAHPDADTRSALSILFLIRCAFAHNPLVPTWRIDDKRFQDKIFTVSAIGLSLNTAGLNGQVGTVDKIGGWVGALRLVDYCLSVIAPTEHAAMTKP